MDRTLTNANAGLPLEQGGEKYDRILDAAIEVIAAKGLQHARIADIASRAGVADGTVYLYFENKGHILRAAIDSAFEQFSERVSASLTAVESPVEQLHIIARLHLETLVTHRNLALILQTQVRQSPKSIEQFSQHSLGDYINLIREVIRNGQAKGVFRAALSDRTAALCLFSALDEMISSWLVTGRSIDPERTASEVLDILLNGLGDAPDHA